MFGALLLALGVLAAIPLPELGIPLVLWGLRLLGERYAWARRANAWVDARWSAARARFHALPVAGRAAVIVALLVLGAALAWLLLQHF